jgi:hypothetical protein
VSLAQGKHQFTDEELTVFCESQFLKPKGRGKANMEDSEVIESLLSGEKDLLLADFSSRISFSEGAVPTVLGSPLMYGRVMSDYEQNPKGVVRELCNFLVGNKEEPKKKEPKKTDKDQ